MQPNRQHRRREPGFTLTEAMVALSVLGLAVGAALAPITAAVQQKHRAARQTVAVMLAEQMIEECIARQRWSFDEGTTATLGPQADETTRYLYDERVDYHDVVETASQIAMLSGKQMPTADFNHFRRELWAQQFYLPGQYTGYPKDVLMLTVRVYDGDQELATLSRLVTNHDHPYP